MEQNDSTAAPEPARSEDREWLEARFTALETHNRRLKRRMGLVIALAAGSAFAVAALALAAVSGGDANPSILTAQGFMLVDAEGQPRGSFSIADDGAAQMILQDRQSSDRLRMTVRSEGSPGIAFADRTGSRRIVLGLLPDETSTLVFADGGGSIRAVLGLSTDNRANLVFADRKGVTRAGLGVDERGVASLVLPEEDVEDSENGEVIPASQEPGEQP